jgi:uncharacterized membrane protein
VAATGLVIAGYLSLFELGVTARVWDPVFGSGSEQVLTSALATSLPVPDAVLGMAAYLTEAVLALVGSEQRWLEQPRIVLAYGALSTALACTAIGLVAVQSFVVGAWCLLCLGSAAISLSAFALAAPEVAATIRHLRGQRHERAAASHLQHP